MHRFPGAAAALALLVFSIANTGTAYAAPVLVDAGVAPVIAVRLRSGSLTIRTWNRNQVQIDTQGTVDWLLATPRQVARLLPPTQSVLAQTAQTPAGPVTLPPESFVLPPLPPGQHRGVRITGEGATTIVVPQGTAVILAKIGGGSIDLQGYHQGAFFAVVHTGNIVMNDISGTGFVQAVKGRVYVANSTLDRIRVRTGAGNIGFVNCVVQQIEVTSIRGSIVYDNGSFQPGLAHFESQYGNIALGVGPSGAQITAHGTAGHIFTDFTGRSSVSVAGADARGAIGGGGPAVTASTANGAILLYDGPLRVHPSIASNAPEMRGFLLRGAAKFVRPAGAPTQSRAGGQSNPRTAHRGKLPPH